MVEDNNELVKYFETLSDEASFEYLALWAFDVAKVIVSKSNTRQSDVDDTVSIGTQRAIEELRKLQGIPYGPKHTPWYIIKCIQSSIKGSSRELQLIIPPRGEPFMEYADIHEFESELMLSGSVVYELWESLLATAENEQESILLIMRAEGCTDDDIAEYLNQSRSYITKLRHRILKRWQTENS
jgi:hypothetical protein